jgi:hypothetical protein
MTRPDLMMALARGRIDDLRRSAGHRLPEQLPLPSQRVDAPENVVTLRLAVAIQDDEVIGRPAALDDSGIPAAPVLLAVVDGEPLAALSLTDRRAISDPFHRTAHLVDLLRARACRLTRTGRLRRPRRSRSLSALGAQLSEYR